MIIAAPATPLIPVDFSSLKNPEVFNLPNYLRSSNVKKIFTLAIISTLASTILISPSQAVTPSTPTKALVTPTWLASNLKDPKLVLIHVGDNDRSIYARGHIEGAQYIDWKTELANSSESKLRNGVVTRANFFRAARNLCGLTVLHIDKGFDLIGKVTGVKVERLKTT